MSAPIHYRSIGELSQQLRSGDATAIEIAEHFIERTQNRNAHLHAVITLADEQALERAAEVDRLLQNGQPVGPLAGIPLTVKDAIPTKGIRTTYNSRLRMDWIPDTEPQAITRLRDAGATILAKANANEFLGIPSDADRFPRPRNPFNPDYVAIGSSSGSGVALAAGLCSASIGSDGAGSVRLPAGQHGLVGVKATNGRVTTWGTGKQSSLQVLGPLTWTIADAALLLEIMAGFEPRDATSWPEPVPRYTEQLEADIQGWRVGVPWQYIETAPVDPEITESFKRAVDDLAKLGVEIEPISIPGLAEGRMATFVVLYTEHHVAHAQTTRTEIERYGRSAALYATQGAFITALDYLNAREFGYRLRNIVEDKLEGLRAILMPTSPFVTAEAARKPSEHRQGINTAFTGPFNLTGHPAITVPCGVSSIGIPVGLQLVGHLYDELSLLQLGAAYEEATDWFGQHPEL